MGLTGRRTGRKSSIIEEDLTLRLQGILCVIYGSIIMCGGYNLVNARAACAIM